ncbi:MAG: universal stress protein [Ilumatobacteraceae bacterium]
MSDYKKIVVGIDGSPASLKAVVWAAHEAKLRNSEIEILHSWSMPFVVDPMAMMPMMFPVEEMVADANKIVAAAAAIVAGIESKIHVVTRVERGAASEHLITAGKSADLLVVGSRGHGGFAGLLLGSVAQQVANHAPCPVVIVPVK